VIRVGNWSSRTQPGVSPDILAVVPPLSESQVPRGGPRWSEKGDHGARPGSGLRQESQILFGTAVELVLNLLKTSVTSTGTGDVSGQGVRQGFLLTVYSWCARLWTRRGAAQARQTKKARTSTGARWMPVGLMPPQKGDFP
jgi:hypothetical protein